MYTCAKCGVRACRKAEDRALPKNCPIREEELSEQAFQEYRSEDNFKFYVTASEIEGLGQFQWPRVKETIELCRRMGYHRIGLAFCSGLSKEAKVMCDLLQRNGFEVVSVMCKVGGRDKCAAGVPDEHKLHPGQYEAMCNPIFQARLLNGQKTEFNIALGLCGGPRFPVLQVFRRPGDHSDRQGPRAGPQSGRERCTALKDTTKTSWMRSLKACIGHLCKTDKN